MICERGKYNDRRKSEKAEALIENETFMLTYGDAVGNVNIKDLLAFHRQNGTMMTMTAVQPAGRFGALDIDRNLVTEFVEKPVGDGHWINGGFMVCEPSILNLIDSDRTVPFSNSIHYRH